jgi:hypothetical protein
MSITSYNEIWVNVKATLLQKLYILQIKHWNLRLQKLMQKNANFHGIVLTEFQCATAAIQYKYKTWTTLPLNWMEPAPPIDYHFTLFPGEADVEAELILVSSELTKIKKERYESDRFMSTLGLHTPTHYELADILGDNLFTLIRKVSQPLSQAEDQAMQMGTIEEFLDKHSSILDHMQERVLVNLLMSDFVK